jgi:hypothetical protein
MKTKIIKLFFLLFLAAGFITAQDQCLHSAAGSLAPLGVMGSHTHNKGSWMFSYQIMHMNMRDNLTGRQKISQPQILSDYLMAPGNMTMQMHMFMGMYAVSDKLTLMGMIPYLRNNMSMADRMGMYSDMRSSNLGDVSISALYSIFKTHHNSLQVNLGLSAPTGSIQESIHADHMHGHIMEVFLPYMMQTGSGTWDLLPAINYTTVLNSFVYGIQSQGRVRTGENSKNYRFGHMASLESWLSYQQNNWLSFSVRLQGIKNWSVRGEDHELNPMMAPTSDAFNTGGEILNSFLGSSIAFNKGALRGQRLAMEYGIPLYQNLNGIQMQTKGNLIVGWQFSF